MPASILALGAATAAAFYLDACDLVFRCGCVSWWRGAAAACNIHAPAPPHCPFCATGRVGGYTPLALVIGAQAAAAFAVPRLRPLPRLALVLGLFPVVVAATGAVYGLVLGYWR